MLRKLMLLMTIMCLLIGSGCSSSTKSYTFNVETGDSIRIELDTTGGAYDLKQEGGRFSIVSTEDNEVLTQGIFILPEYYESYVESAKLFEYEWGSKDNNVHIFYEYFDDTHFENNYIVDITDATVHIILASVAEKDVAQEIFNLLTITAE